MSKLTTAEWRELKELETRVEVALETATAAGEDAPEALRELLLDSLAQLQALTSRSEDRRAAVEGIERALAALEAWHRWQPSTHASA